MPVAFPIRGPWRIDTPNKRLAVALASSLLIHGILYGTWRIAPIVSAAVRSAATRVLAAINPRLVRPTLEQKKAEISPKREVPMIFVEVDPALASAEPPKETKFYSTHDSVAANPSPRQADVPKIDGAQTKVVRMVDNPKPKPQPLQPAARPEPQPEQTAQVEKPVEPARPQEKPQDARPKTQEIGELALAMPQPKIATPASGTTEATVQPQPHTKPRTLSEVIQRNPALAGQQMRQEGGVPRARLVPSLDARGLPFGDYDLRFIQAVEACWYDQIERSTFRGQGRVVVEFKLHRNGLVTDLRIAESSVNEIGALLCHIAIEKPSPYGEWDIAMRRHLGETPREVRFTFYYD